MMVCTFLRGGFSLFASHLVGAGPRLYRMHPMASPMRGSCRREATDEVGQLRNRKTPTSSVSASPSHLPLIGEGFGLRPVYLMGYVTPSTVMEARSARSMSWENSHVCLTRSASGIPVPEELMEP